MKHLVKGMILAIALSFGCSNIMAQGFLKKLSKATENIVSELESATGNDEQDSDSIDVKALINEEISFNVKKVYELTENGDTIKNDDGTAKFSYHIIDNNGKVCSPKYAKEVVNRRLKEVGKVLAKVGGGAVAGAGASLLAGGNKKDALKAGGIGAAAGLIASKDEIKQIRILSKQLKEYNNRIEEYEQTFNEEGQPKDAAADLSAYNDCEEISKSSNDIFKELEESNEEMETL